MIVLTVLAALLIQTDAKVSMLNGQEHKGALTSISESEVALLQGGAEIILPVDEVMAIDFPAATPVVSDEVQMLFLSDGSMIHATSVARNAMSLSAMTSLCGKIEVAVEDIRAVRLQTENPIYAQQWSTFLKRESDKDNLVVAKRDGSGLDFLSGIVNTIDTEQIGFLLDGESIPVPAERVYGIVFGRRPGSKETSPASRAVIQLMSTAGDIVAARTVVSVDDQVQVLSGWNQQLSVPIARLQKIDLSSGRIQFLSDMPTLAERFDGVDPENSLFTGLIDREQQLMLFGPQRNTTMERTSQSRIRLRGREFSKGLCIHSRTEMKWSLDKRFSAMECIVGIDDEVAFNGAHAVALKITGDDAVLFEKLISTTDDPLPVRLQLEGVTLLTILVDFGDGSSVCDWLDIADAKLVIAKEKK